MCVGAYNNTICVNKPANIARLIKRADFVRLSRGRYTVTPGFILQHQKQVCFDMLGTSRVGFTASKKIGNAVIRNRAKRRLRALASNIMPIYGQNSYDYVLIARQNVTVERNFEKMCQDLKRVLAKVHEPGT